MFGAITMLFVALGIDFFMGKALNNYITNNFTGDSLLLAQIMLVIVLSIITIALPILGAVEDDYE